MIAASNTPPPAKPEDPPIILPPQPPPPPQPPRPPEPAYPLTDLAWKPRPKEDIKVVLNSVTGPIDVIYSHSKADAVKQATDIFRSKRLIDDSEECRECKSAVYTACCLEFRQQPVLDVNAVQGPTPDGFELGLEQLEPEAGSNETEETEILGLVTFSDERGLDPELVGFVRDLPLQPAGRQSLLTQFQHQGIKSKSQLAGINPVDLDLSSEDSITRNNVQSQLATAKERESQKLSATGKTRSNTNSFLNSYGAQGMMQAAQSQANDALNKASAARQALADATSQVAKDGNNQLSAASKKALEDALAELDRLNLQEADLDLSSVSSQIDGLIASGGYVSGWKLGTMETVDTYGLLRGVLVTDRPGQDGLPVDRLAPVCSFKPRLAKDEEQLKAAITLDPDLESSEYFLEAEDARDVQTANSIISSYGTSAMSALANNFGFGLSASAGTPNIVGGGSVGVSTSKSSSRGEASRGRESSTRLLQSKVKDLSKSRYYFLPKLAINIDPFQLDASPEFKLSWSEVAYMLCQQRGDVGCSRFEVNEDNVYGVTFSSGTKPDESKATTLVSFIATNFKATLTTSSSIKPIFTAAVRAAFDSAFQLEDGEEWSVEVSFPSALVVQDKWSNVQVVVKIPPKPFPDASPTSEPTRAEFMRKWLAKGWMQSNILGQLGIPTQLKTPPVSLGEQGLTRVTVETEYSDEPANDTNGTASNTTTLVQRRLARQDVRVVNTSSATNVTDAMVNQKVRELIYKFGSHICPDAVLGGYWRIDAKYSSLETKERVEVDNLVSLAIEEAETKAKSFSASAGIGGIGSSGGGLAGGSAEETSSSSSSGSEDNTGGDAEAQQTASKTTKLTIEQKWKGGAEGTQPGDWRRSLDSSFSSNWKVIDHVFPKCVGIWRFVDDQETQRKLCENWLEIYLDEGPNQGVTKRIEESVRTKACESTLNMNSLRQEAQELVRLDSEAQTRLTLELCEGNKAFKHFRFVPTKLRDAGATKVAIQGIRLGLDEEPVSPASVTPAQLATGGFEFNLGAAVYMSFTEKQSVTDFSYLLTSDKYGQDPVQFNVQAADDKNNGPWTTLLTFTMDARAQLLSAAPGPGETTTFRDAWSRWLPLQGAAEGYYWDRTDQECKEKQCFCTASNGTDVLGTTGRACDADNGALNCPSCCRDEQRAKCSSFDCSAVGPNAKAKAAAALAKCQSGLCTVEADGGTCCQDATLAQTFILTIKTENTAGCGSDVWVEAAVDGVNEDGDAVTNSNQTMDTQNFDDFRQNSVQDYRYQSSERIRPTRVCLHQMNRCIGGGICTNDNWCPEYVRVSNGEIAGAPQIGLDVTGWTQLDRTAPSQCLNLDFQ